MTADNQTLCTQCQREILVATATRNGGLCGVCFGESQKREKLLRQWTSNPQHVHAANSSDELAYLRNLIRHMMATEPKREYANWLKENGEVAKATFMERWMTAFESLSGDDLPDNDSVENCWSRMVGGNTLRMLVMGSQHLDLVQRRHLRDIVFRYLEPSIVIRYCTGEGAYSDFTPNPQSSHYFGDPDLSDDIAWPTYADCLHDFEDTDGLISTDSPCLFACQVRSKDLGLFVAADFLASDEMLSFFTFVEVDSLGSQSICVVPQSDLSRLRPRQQPHDATEMNATISARPLYFLEELSLPQSFYSKFTDILDLEGRVDDGVRLYNAIACAGTVRGEHGWSDLGMFGYLHASSGGDPSRSTSDRLLASIRCSLDAGILTLGIDGNSLATRNWRNARIAWLDWDG
jgi:hypothetical protein